MLELVQKAGWVAWPLMLFSVVALAIILERLFSLANLKRLESRAFEALLIGLQDGKALSSIDPELSSAPVAVVLETVAVLSNASEEARYLAAEVAISVQRLRLRRYLSVLATIGTISPFVGLFGTVLGVLYSFQAMHTKGLGGQEMAGGIGEALSATALGLAVAIPSVMAYNYFTTRIQAMLLDVHSHSARLMPLLKRETSNSSSSRGA